VSPDDKKTQSNISDESTLCYLDYRTELRMRVPACRGTYSIATNWKGGGNHVQVTFKELYTVTGEEGHAEKYAPDPAVRKPETFWTECQKPYPSPLGLPMNTLIRQIISAIPDARCRFRLSTYSLL